MSKKLKLFMVIDLIITGIILSIFFFTSNNSQDNKSDFTLSSEQNNNVESTDAEETENPASDIVFVILFSLTTFVISAFVFKGFLKYLFGNKDRNRILASGRPAKAKVIKLGESGRGIVTINEQPFVSLKLEVYDGSKPPYQVELKTIVARLDIPRLQPGAELAIKIDPNNPEKIAIDPEGEYFQNNVPLIGKKYSKEEQEIYKNKGIKAKAKIISINDTGESKDFNSIVKIVYEVYRENKNPYTVTKKIPLSTEDVKKMKTFIGKIVPAKIHPNDSHRVELIFIP